MSASPQMIRQMLQSLEVEERNLEQRLTTVKQRKAILQGWLADEEPTQDEMPLNGGDYIPSPLSRLLQGILADGHAHSTELLAVAAAGKGLIAPGKSAKRSVNFALLALKNRGYVKTNKEGEWLIKN
jgi:hypothetical protein